MTGSSVHASLSTSCKRTLLQIFFGFVKKHPFVFFATVFLSAISPIESVLMPILIGKLSDKIIAAIENKTNPKLRREAMVPIFLIAGLFVFFVAAYNVDLVVSRLFIGLLTSHIQVVLLANHLRKVSPQDGSEDKDVTFNIKVFTEATGEYVNAIRNVILPDIVGLLFQSIYLTAFVDWVLGGCVFLFAVCVGYCFYSAHTNVLGASGKAFDSENCASDHITDTIANIDTLHGCEEAIGRELAELQIRGDTYAQDLKNTAVSAVSSSRFPYIFVIVAAGIYLARFSRLFIWTNEMISSGGEKRKPTSPPGSGGVSIRKPVTAITILFSALRYVRAMLTHLFEVRDCFSRMVCSANVCDDGWCDTSSEDAVSGDEAPPCRNVSSLVARRKNACSAQNAAGQTTKKMNAMCANSSHPPPRTCVPNDRVVCLKQVTFAFKSGENEYPPLFNPHNEGVGMNLEIFAGERVCIHAPNGFGKSTLFKLCRGTIVAESGTVEIDRQNTEVFFAAQFPKFFNRTLMENLCGHDMTPEEVRRIISNDTKMQSIISRAFKTSPSLSAASQFAWETIGAGKAGSNLSGGQRQVLQLVKIALRVKKQQQQSATSPPSLSHGIGIGIGIGGGGAKKNLLLLDEITASVDAVQRSLVTELLFDVFLPSGSDCGGRNTVAENSAIIFVTHDEEFRDEFATRVIEFDV